MEAQDKDHLNIYQNITDLLTSISVHMEVVFFTVLLPEIHPSP